MSDPLDLSNFSVPVVNQNQPQLTDEQKRMQMIGKMMMQNSMKTDPTQNVGGFSVPQSPMSGIAKLVQAYAGANMADQGGING